MNLRLGLALALVLLSAAPAGAAAAVHLRGTAYEFNNTDVKLAGASIRVAEDSRLRATTRRDGTYDLRVPDGTRITPYIVADGYHTIHLQTFRTDGEHLERVNFQTPTDAVYQALAALLDVPLGPDGEPTDCAIVSTFSVREVRDVGFDRFTGFGAHGVAGATATTSPALPAPTYFNEQVVPDPAQRRSSDDGGVIWTRVPAGRYTVRARHADTRFASFIATCEPGRIVNANPPWGLHELGRRNRSRVTADWMSSGGGFDLERLRVTRRPREAVVHVRCSGPRCPFRTRTAGRKAFSAQGFRAGQTVEVVVTAPEHDGRLVRWRLRAGKRPVATVRCVPLGHTRARLRC